VTAEICRHPRADFRASLLLACIATLEETMIRERLRLRGDKQSAREADAIERLMEAVGSQLEGM
jgi:hypothetical protein